MPRAIRVLLILAGWSLATLLVRASDRDIILYAQDAHTISGSWSLAPSASAAGGQMLTTADAGWSVTEAPLATPSHYAEFAFEADADVAYQVWFRLRAAGDSKWNDSVWAQFDDAIDAAGNPLWRIGTTAGLLVNLEACGGCGVAGWGWQDNAWWTGQTARVRFAAAGTHTLRVQLREDGVAIDQVVLSPVTWWSSPPGSARHDTTIVPQTDATTITVVRAPYLQQVGHGRATVVWAARENGTGRLRYGPGHTGSVSPATVRRVPAATTNLAYDYYQYEATLSGLQASTGYDYVAEIDGHPVASPARLTTAPPPGQGHARFIAFGDSGTGSTEQRALAARMAAEPFDFAVHTGDVAYGTSSGIGPGGYPQLQAWFFDIYREWLGRRPMFPSIGNHDEEASRAGPWRDVFVLPAHGASSTYPDHAERFYSFDYGPVHVVVLDTELAFQSPERRAAQLEWLRADLAGATTPWKVAVFHRSPYSAGGEHGSDLAVRAAFGPVFEAHGVAVAFSGHEHTYERTVPIRENASGSPVVYVVTGGGGAKLYPAATAWWTASSRSAFHYMRASATACVLSIDAVGLDGKTFDSTTLDRCAGGGELTTAYGGTPAAIPGQIEAEHFDQGSSGVAYRDSTPGNSGGQFRATDVDVQATSDTGGGYNVGWMTASEWLAFTVDVSSAGTYAIEARVASAGPGGTFHVEMGGVDVSGPLTIPDTGGWQRWTTIRRADVTLNPGRHDMRIVLDANGPTGVFGNLNYLRVSPQSAATPFGGAAAPVPGTIEAEAFDDGGPGVGYHDTTAGNAGGRYRSTDVDIEATTDTGGGHNVGWIAPGEWLVYTVDVAASGSYTLAARVAARGPGGTFHVEVDGADVTGPLAIPDTGGWQAWITLSRSGIPLAQGRRTLRVIFDGSGPTGVVGNLNRLTFTAQ